jgi:hypothetical protein
MIGAELVRMAADLIEGQQEESGPPQDLFPVLAARWSPVLGTEVTPAQVVLCLLDLKMVRLAHNLRHIDSIKDRAGYAGCLADLILAPEMTPDMTPNLAVLEPTPQHETGPAKTGVDVYQGLNAFYRTPRDEINP